MKSYIQWADMTYLKYFKEGQCSQLQVFYIETYSFIKNSCYKSLIVPILEYFCTVWDPHILKDINRTDKIQRHAATCRFVKNNYSWISSVTGLINKLKFTDKKN